MLYFQPLSQTLNVALRCLRRSQYRPITFPAAIALGQVAENSDKEPVRVTVSLNAGGSRTTYRFDRPNKKATALTTGPDGKVREKSHTNSTIADGSLTA